jgi:hypothetical protein
MQWIPTHRYLEPMVNAFREGSSICSGDLLVGLISSLEDYSLNLFLGSYGAEILRKDQDPEVETNKGHIHTIDVICLIVVTKTVDRRTAIYLFLRLPTPSRYLLRIQRDDGSRADCRRSSVCRNH